MKRIFLHIGIAAAGVNFGLLSAVFPIFYFPFLLAGGEGASSFLINFIIALAMGIIAAVSYILHSRRQKINREQVSPYLTTLFISFLVGVAIACIFTGISMGKDGTGLITGY